MLGAHGAHFPVGWPAVDDLSFFRLDLPPIVVRVLGPSEGCCWWRLMGLLMMTWVCLRCFFIFPMDNPPFGESIVIFLFFWDLLSKSKMTMTTTTMIMEKMMKTMVSCSKTHKNPDDVCPTEHGKHINIWAVAKICRQVVASATFGSSHGWDSWTTQNQSTILWLESLNPQNFSGPHHQLHSGGVKGTFSLGGWTSVFRLYPRHNPPFISILSLRPPAFWFCVFFGSDGGPKNLYLPSGKIT